MTFYCSRCWRKPCICHPKREALPSPKESAEPKSFCSRCGGKDPECYICGSLRPVGGRS